MPSTIAVQERMTVGNLYACRGTGNLGVYNTGGVSITARQMGLSRFAFVNIFPAAGYIFDLTYSADRSSVTARARVPFAVDTSSNTTGNLPIQIKSTGVGVESSGGSLPAVQSMFVAKEVTNNFDLTNVTFQWEATGY